MSSLQPEWEERANCLAAYYAVLNGEPDFRRALSSLFEGFDAADYYERYAPRWEWPGGWWKDNPEDAEEHWNRILELVPGLLEVRGPYQSHLSWLDARLASGQGAEDARQHWTTQRAELADALALRDSLNAFGAKWLIPRDCLQSDVWDRYRLTGPHWWAATGCGGPQLRVGQWTSSLPPIGIPYTQPVQLESGVEAHVTSWKPTITPAIIAPFEYHPLDAWLKPNWLEDEANRAAELVRQSILEQGRRYEQPLIDAGWTRVGADYSNQLHLNCVRLYRAGVLGWSYTKIGKVEGRERIAERNLDAPLTPNAISQAVNKLARILGVEVRKARGRPPKLSKLPE